MNYGELKTLVEFYLHRTDFVTIWNQIFDQVTERVSKDARLLAMESKAVLTLIDNAASLPADFVEARSVMQAATFGKEALQYLDRQAFENRARQYTGGFSAYTIDGFTIEAGKNADIDLYYFARPASLVNDGDTNTILTAYPNLYVFGGLMYAHNAVQDYESEQVATDRYISELQAANDADEKARRSGDAPAMIAR